MFFGAPFSAGVTSGTAMVKTAVKFINGVGFSAIPIDFEVCAGHRKFTPIVHMLNIMAIRGMRVIWVRQGHEAMSFQIFIT